MKRVRLGGCSLEVPARPVPVVAEQVALFPEVSGEGDKIAGVAARIAAMPNEELGLGRPSSSEEAERCSVHGTPLGRDGECRRDGCR